MIFCMKVLIVVNVDYFFVSHRLNVGLRALKEGWEVHVATELTSKRELLESCGFFVHHIPVGRNTLNPYRLIKMAWCLGGIIKKIRPDVIHLVTIKPVLIGGSLARLFKVGAVVYAVSGLGYVFTSGGRFSSVRRFLVHAWYKFVLSAENKIIIFQNLQDRNTIESIKKLSETEVMMIPGSGVDLVEYGFSPFQVNDFSEIKIIMASRLLVEKGVREFVEAARQITSRCPHVRFTLVGAPDTANPASITEKELKNWKDEGCVEVLGARTDVAALMQQSHIVVLPSYYGEGLPKVLIEAAACGRAVITTDMPGCRDAIEHGVTGLLVKPRDVDDLIDAIQGLIDNPELCIELGKAGRRRAELLFDVNDVAQKHMDVYDRVFKGNSCD